MSDVGQGIGRRGVLAAGGAAAAVGLTACGSSGSSTTSSSAEGAAAGTGGTSVKTADVPVGGGVIEAGAKIVVTQPTEGTFKAFSAVCTHQHCLVSGVTSTINCSCHNSQFSLTDGSPVAGPARTPLPSKTVTVSGDTLTVS